MRSRVGALARILPASLLLLVLTGCVRPLPSKLNATGRTISVCELSQNFGAYAGAIVTVRGIYYHGLRQRCPQTCPAGEPWPSVLDLASPTYGKNGGLQVPFSTDQASWEVLDRAVLRAAEETEKTEVWATIRGYLVARSNSPLGPCDQVADGMLGGLYARGRYGAKLIVERVDDVQTRRNAATGYDYTEAGRPPRSRPEPSQ